MAPDVFGAAGRMEDYWGPPSFAWQDTGLFVAQNMGVLYIGGVAAAAACMDGAAGRPLAARDSLLHLCGRPRALLYALGWYTPVFEIIYELVPGIQLYRRPADAAFLIGGLGAILAGYGAHRLFSAPGLGFDPRVIRIMAGLLAAALRGGNHAGDLARPHTASVAAAGSGRRGVCCRRPCPTTGEAAARLPSPLLRRAAWPR